MSYAHLAFARFCLHWPALYPLLALTSQGLAYLKGRPRLLQTAVQAEWELMRQQFATQAPAQASYARCLSLVGLTQLHRQLRLVQKPTKADYLTVLLVWQETQTLLSLHAPPSAPWMPALQTRLNQGILAIIEDVLEDTSTSSLPLPLKREGTSIPLPNREKGRGEGESLNPSQLALTNLINLSQNFAPASLALTCLYRLCLGDANLQEQLFGGDIAFYASTEQASQIYASWAQNLQARQKLLNDTRIHLERLTLRGPNRLPHRLLQQLNLGLPSTQAIQPAPATAAEDEPAPQALTSPWQKRWLQLKVTWQGLKQSPAWIKTAFYMRQGWQRFRALELGIRLKYFFMGFIASVGLPLITLWRGLMRLVTRNRRTTFSSSRSNRRASTQEPLLPRLWAGAKNGAKQAKQVWLTNWPRIKTGLKQGGQFFRVQLPAWVKKRWPPRPYDYEKDPHRLLYLQGELALSQVLDLAVLTQDADLALSYLDTIEALNLILDFIPPKAKMDARPQALPPQFWLELTALGQHLPRPTDYALCAKLAETRLAYINAQWQESNFFRDGLLQNLDLETAQVQVQGLYQSAGPQT